MASSSGIERLLKDEGGHKLTGHLVKGKLHIGAGFLLERSDAEEQLIMAGVSPGDVDDVMKVGGKAITQMQSEALFQNALLQAEGDAEAFVGDLKNVPQVVRDTFVNMAYQLGSKGLREFEDMKTAVDKRDWEGVSREMLDSKWARKDTPSRANRLAKDVRALPKTKSLPKAAVISQKDAVAMNKMQTVAAELGGMLSRQANINSLGKLLSESREQAAVETETQTETKPKMQRLEQGLFEDETGKKFFVDTQNRLLELGEDNQPKAVIDPSKFDLSGV